MNKTAKITLKTLATVLLFWMYSGPITAQIIAPEFLCVSNDTLIWETPINTCGNFNAYQVFGSMDIAGPYTEITSISDEFETTFVHSTAGTATWFYYLQTDADCLGHPTLQSDTLDNLIPLAGGISSVTVNGSVVELEWYLSPSPEVFAYIISKETNLGTTIIDTVYTGTSYFDFDGLPGEKFETYFVTAIDRCGNKSLVVNPHNTMFLESANNGGCERSITLSWNAYQNWNNDLERYDIYVSTDGGDFEIKGSTANGVTTFDFEDVSESSIYCFFIEAIENGTGISSRSNQICGTIELIQPVKGLALMNGKVISEHEVQLSWVWSTNSTLTQTSILFSTDGTNFTAVEDFPVQLPLANANSIILQENAFNDGPTYYQVETTDSCDVVLGSNIIGLIYLSGRTTGAGTNYLEWTPYINSLLDTTDLEYDLFRLSTAVPEKLATIGSNETFSYEDLISLSDPSQVESCYYIVARGFITLPDGTVLETASSSNTICLFQRANFYTPNAFAPEGVNRVFKPILQFGNPLDYNMTIYDRWGGLIFESQDIGMGWNGDKNGTAMPQGVYVYRIIMTKDNGDQVENTGSVVLMR